ncbi:hypothetical protein TNCV_4863381 [Trichonephila clavipes]|nr:hypothetical protein TNCV_4863381 [Trichonephila clavipes]
MPVDFGTLSKIKNQRTVSHRQRSSASLWGGNWASKLPVVIGIRLYGAALKEIPAPGECNRSAMVKHQSAASLKIKKEIANKN